MNKNMYNLVETLKAEGEDFEFYPTTKSMVKTIWKHGVENYNVNKFWSVLDIGCGTCNFKRWIDELNEESKANSKDKYSYTCIYIKNYYVMEKSKILLERLDPDTIALGTDFDESTLIDKEVDTIFCNPPYSVFEDWTYRIILESNCKQIYLIIPERWKNNEKIKQALIKTRTKVELLDSTDFYDAERNARAKVDILYINKECSVKDAGFDAMFDSIFGMSDEAEEDKYTVHEKEFENLKNELAVGKNKVEILCDGYNKAREQLFYHFKTISEMDSEVLKSIGVFKDNVKKALKIKIEGMKNVYWEAAFNCLDEITSRLTSTSRTEVLSRFRMLKTVDFTPSNLYAMIIWVIKNYNKYTEKQMLDLFYALSSKENVRNYVSNKRAFEEYRYRCDNRERSTHYTLDYRIIATSYALPGEGVERYYEPTVKEAIDKKISDICAIANNLGFESGTVEYPENYGQLGKVYDKNGDVIFTFRLYQNKNVHLKFNIEFMKAFNVAVGQKLGWIKKPEDIKNEFTEEMSKGAEKYYNRLNTKLIDITKASTLMITGGE